MTKTIDLTTLATEPDADQIAQVLEDQDDGADESATLWTTQFAASGKAGKIG